MNNHFINLIVACIVNKAGLKRKEKKAQYFDFKYNIICNYARKLFTKLYYWEKLEWSTKQEVTIYCNQESRRP